MKLHKQLINNDNQEKEWSFCLTSRGSGVRAPHHPHSGISDENPGCLFSFQADIPYPFDFIFGKLKLESSPAII